MSWAESKEAGTEAGQGRGKLLSVDWLTKSSPGALSIYEKNPEISVVAKVEFPIGKKLFHLVVNPGTWPGARP